MSEKQKGALSLLVAATLAGSFGVFAHFISFNIPLFARMLAGNSFQLAAGLVLYILFDKKRPLNTKDLKWFALRSGCGFINVITLYVAFTRISIGTGYFLSFAVATICGYMLGSLLFKEQLTPRGIIALGMSIAGLLLIYSLNFEWSTIWYTTAAAISGVVAPGWSVFSKQISKTYSNIQMNVVDTVFAVLFTIIFFLASGEKWVPITWSPVWIASFSLAFIFFIVGFLTVYGFKHVDAQAGTLLVLFEVVAGIGLGYIFYRQTVPPRDMVGGGLILLAICLRTYSSKPVISKKRRLVRQRAAANL